MDALPATPSACPNLLLSLLPDAEYTALRPHLELVPTPLHFKLFERDLPIPYAYFPCSGEHSILATTAEGQAVEVGTTGYEGMSTVDLLLDAEVATETTVCQIAGASLRIRAAEFKRLLRELPGLKQVTNRYLLAYIAMVSQSVACNALHPLEARFARWMLMTHDRVPADEFRITHEYIAMMLGTHRPSVSLVAATFQRAGILRYQRGLVSILDRPALEAASCECYGIVHRQFSRFLGKNQSKTRPVPP